MWKVTTTLFLSSILTLAFAEPAYASVQDGADVPANSERVRLEPIESNASRRVLRAHLAGDPITLELTPYSLRSPDFEVLVQDATGALQPFHPPPPNTYRGVVREWERSLVVASLVDGKLNALIRTAERGDWAIEPAAGDEPAARDHFFYNVADLPHVDGVCGVTPADEAAARARPAEFPRAPSGDGGQDGPRGGPADTEISFDSDVEFFQANGSSVAATVDDIETVMVAVDAMYRSEVGIMYVVNRIIVRTAEPDPYTFSDAIDLLEQFRDHWEDNHGGQERDLAHLMTGRNLDGTIIGRAYIGEVCNSLGYGLSQSRFSTSMAQRVALTAHELGHNWDAIHCDGDPDCMLMCANLGGCTGILNQFGSRSIGDIVDHRDSRDCLGGHNFSVYVDDSNNSGFEDGSLENPFNTLREGLWAVEPGGTIILFGGTYDWDRTARILNRDVAIRSQPGTGTAVIGQ